MYKARCSKLSQIHYLDELIMISFEHFYSVQFGVRKQCLNRLEPCSVKEMF